MLTILFFAQTRELVGESQLTLPANKFKTVEELRQYLITKGDKWKLAFETGRLLVAVNQKIVPMNTVLHSNDEVAFFPPVTGG